MASVMNRFRTWLLAGMALPAAAWAGAAPAGWAPPPGVVIDRSPDPARAYVGSPSIVVLPDGRLVASHDFFGKPGPLLRSTWVFRSADGGRTWCRVAHLQDQTWSTLFVHHGALYLIGTDRAYGDIVLRRSGDAGRTWTEPSDAGAGLLFPGRFHCGPTPVIVHDGRIWRAFERYSGPDGSWSGHFFHPLVVSAPVGSDLLRASSWTRTNDLTFDPAWVKGDRTGWLEGNVVAAPDGRLLDLLRVNAPPTLGDAFPLDGPAAGIPRYEVAAAVEVAADGRAVSFNPGRGFFRFPGSQSKFTIRFDPVSRLYWSVANRITNPYSGYPRNISPELQRNVLDLVCSPDLRHWTIRYTVLRWHEGLPLTLADHVAFQYADWQFDGPDLVVVSRTSWNGESYHNANLLTFHRIRGFRTVRPSDSPPPLRAPVPPSRASPVRGESS